MLLGGLVAWGIGHINSTALAHWQYLFLILGAITSAYAIFLIFVLPDSPSKAIFLKSKERAIAVQRTLTDKTGSMESNLFDWHQARDAFTDPQTWFLVLNSFCNNLCNGGITTVCLLDT